MVEFFAKSKLHEGHGKRRKFFVEKLAKREVSKRGRKNFYALVEKITK